MEQVNFSNSNNGFNSSFVDAVLHSSIVSRTDSNGVITFVNENFLRISKYSFEELVGKPHSIVNSRFHPREFWRNVWRKICRGEMWRGEVCNHAKDGSLYWVDTFIYPCYNDEGKLEGYFSIRNDITQRKKQEEELLKYAIELKSIFDSTTDAYFLFTPDVKLITCNVEAEKILVDTIDKGHAKDKQDAITKLLYMQPGFTDRFERAVNGETVDLEKESVRTDEAKVWEHIRYLPVYDDKRNIAGVSLSVSNIQTRKMQEKALLDIAWSQSHEMRRPVASILGLIQLLQKDEQAISNQEFRSHLKVMAEELDTVIRKNVGRTYEYSQAS